MIYILPESVFRYLKEPSVQGGVDAVLEYGIKKLPPGLEWEELPQYNRAALAAVSVQVDWSLALHDLWSAIWPESVSGWRPLTLDEQNTGDYAAQISIAQCWDQEWFGRCFIKLSVTGSGGGKRRQADPPVLCLGVSLSREGFSVGFSIDDPEVAKPDLPQFRFEPDEEGWWTPEQPVSSQDLDLSLVKAAAAEAVTWIQSQQHSG